MAPIIVRVRMELPEQLSTQIETKLFQLTCQRVGNLPSRFQGIANPRHMSANRLRAD
jgi:hypothetical protein